MTIIPISGVIGWDVTGQQVREALAAAKGDAVEIQLSSVGGFVFDGLEIFNLIKNYDGQKTARLMGVAASMGSYIPLAADKIIAEGNAVMMIHNAWGMGMGSAEDLRAEATVLDGLSAILADAYVKKTGKSAEEIKALMDAETWFFGQEMVDAGFVDEIVGTPDQNAKAETVKTARAALADAKKLVAEYEGGDSPRRVAALVDLMRPAAQVKIEKPGVAVAAGPPASNKKGSAKMTTLEELKAENPALYALAESQFTAQGIKAEKDRNEELDAWTDVSPACAAIAQEAKATGKTYAQVASQLSAAAAKGPKAKANDTPPAVASAAPAALGGDTDAEDIQAAKLFGMTMEEYKKGKAAAPAMKEA